VALSTGKHDCPLHQGPESGQAAYHLELRALARTSKAYADDARQSAAKGGDWVTRFGMWRVPDDSAELRQLLVERRGWRQAFVTFDASLMLGGTAQAASHFLTRPPVGCDQGGTCF
jgi:hypothetical protein